MNWQANVFLKILWKMRFFFLLFLVACFGNFYFLSIRDASIPITIEDFLMMLGSICHLEEVPFLINVFSIFQLLLYFLILFYFLTYEKKNSPEFIYLRKNVFALYFQKFIVSVLLISVIRGAYFFLLYQFFSRHITMQTVGMEFDFAYFYASIWNYLIFIGIIFCIVFLYLLVKRGRSHD